MFATYTHVGRPNGVPVFYVVNAVNDQDDSGFSNEASTTPGGGS